MVLRITGNDFLENNISRAQEDANESTERLSSGVKFTRKNPMPAERAQSDALTNKMREINGYKKNAADGMSLTEYADSSLSELSNMNIRMKELVTQATNPTLSDKERQFLFVEYQSLYDEFDRQALTASYNGQSILDYKEGDKKEIGFRIGAPKHVDDKDINFVKLENLDEVKSRAEDIGLISARDLLDLEDGISVDDVVDHFDADDEDSLGETFNAANEKIMGYRAKFGAVTTRLNYATQAMDIAYENIAAANSRIKDVDYATEMSNLTRANILLQAGTSLLTQKQQLDGQSILQLIRGTDK